MIRRTHIAFFAAAGSTLLLAVPPASGQSATLLSQTIWGTPGHETAGGIAVGPDGSTYLTGPHSTEPPLKIFLVKFAADGTIAWQLIWDGPDPFFDSLPTDVAVSTDGTAVYVTGTAFVNPNLGVLLKFNAADGALVWQKSWGGSAFPGGVAVDADGSIYVAGSVRLNFDANQRASITKFAPDGSVLWHRIWNTLESAGETQGEDVALDAAGNVYVVGATPIPDPDVIFRFQVALLKIDGAGNLIWQRTVSEGEQLDARGGLATAPDGSIYVAGGRSDDRRFSFDALVLKFAADGTLLWKGAWGGRSHDEADGVAVRADGTVFVTGTSNSFTASDDAFFLQLTPNGKVVDAATWGGPGTERGDAIAVNPAGDAVIGATVQYPPYAFLGAPARLSKIRTVVGNPGFPLVPLEIANVDAGGTVAPVAGTTNDDPGFDAAVVVIRP